MNKDEIKKALQCCSAVGFETSCSDCPYCYRCNDLSRDALNIITEQEKEIKQLTRELAKEQEACVECELEQSWELFVRDEEINCLRAESKRFENNMKSVLEIEKENARKETAEEFYSEMYDFAYRTKSYYTDALNDIIAKIDETFNDFRVELESMLREYGVEVEE